MNHGTCIHYTGLPMVGKEYKTACCKAGVNYFETFDGRRVAIALRMPCVEFRELPANGNGTYIRPGQETIRKEIDRKGETVIPCHHRVEPTTEQVQQDRIETELWFERTKTAIKVAASWRVRPKPEQDRNEVVECPLCKGRLHLHQSAYNGHVSGKCETEGCVSWVE
ncbi:MAG: hypothetical protein EG825_00205 [Rhodocyclaceae bacterium]|nr:hypothetical protein [Rhodocyclaceae bacterium]